MAARTYEEIDGSRVKSTFAILHSGWEMDNVGWITEDGRVWTTSHGGAPYEMGADELREKISEILSSLDGLINASTGDQVKIGLLIWASTP